MTKTRLENDEIKRWQQLTKKANWKQILGLQEYIDEEITRRHKTKRNK